MSRCSILFVACDLKMCVSLLTIFVCVLKNVVYFLKIVACVLKICVCLLNFFVCLLKICVHLAGRQEDRDREAGIKKSILERGRGIGTSEVDTYLE